MKRMLLAAGLLCMLALATSTARPQGAGRYDQQILSNVARVLAGDAQYKNVTVTAEDGIVTLAGSVELDSARRQLGVKVSHIPHVAGVENRLVLAPPALPDEILYGRVQETLADAGYQGITIEVHQGLVVLKGVVRTQRDWNRVKQIAGWTQGVKEVEARMSIASP
jgi:osmotically-inducible protein OsmY